MVVLVLPLVGLLAVAVVLFLLFKSLTRVAPPSPRRDDEQAPHDRRHRLREAPPGSPYQTFISPSFIGGRVTGWLRARRQSGISRTRPLSPGGRPMPRSPGRTVAAKTETER